MKFILVLDDVAPKDDEMRLVSDISISCLLSKLGDASAPSLSAE